MVNKLLSSSLWHDKTVAENLVKRINKLTSDIYSKTKEDIHVMEVCGTHTMAIAEYGIKKMLPKHLKVLSGPGCPVCVTSQSDIDSVLELAQMKDVIITSFGDMLKVRGSDGKSLDLMRIKNCDVRIVYSPVDALTIAEENPNKKIVFVGVGFETTAPVIAATVLRAEAANIKNFYTTSFFKLITPALRFLLSSKKSNISGFILPGHVSSVTGTKIYDFLCGEYSIPSAAAGFEPVDILSAIEMILKQINSNKPEVQNEYFRAVPEDGNNTAANMVKRVFDVCDAEWRAIGILKNSGLKLSGKYAHFDALKKFNIKKTVSKSTKGCLCGDILLGRAEPSDCKFFGKQCTPLYAIGPCMVSSEGACAAMYKYRD